MKILLSVDIFSKEINKLSLKVVDRQYNLPSSCLTHFQCLREVDVWQRAVILPGFIA